jgi:hypothetical protein
VQAEWSSALESIRNEAEIDYVRGELAKGQKANLNRRSLYYRLGGKVRFGFVWRRAHAWVWQKGRFQGDFSYWRQKLSDPHRVREVDDKRCLSFDLITASDFSAFSRAMHEELTDVVFDSGEPGNEWEGD